MHHIVPLDQADWQTIHSLAESAANNGTPMAEANPFEPGTTSFLSFERQYLECARQLSIADG